MTSLMYLVTTFIIIIDVQELLLQFWMEHHETWQDYGEALVSHSVHSRNTFYLKDIS